MCGIGGHHQRRHAVMGDAQTMKARPTAGDPLRFDRHRLSQETSID